MIKSITSLYCCQWRLINVVLEVWRHLLLSVILASDDKFDKKSKDNIAVLLHLYKLLLKRAIHFRLTSDMKSGNVTFASDSGNVFNLTSCFNSYDNFRFSTPYPQSESYREVPDAESRSTRSRKRSIAAVPSWRHELPDYGEGRKAP